MRLPERPLSYKEYQLQRRTKTHSSIMAKIKFNFRQKYRNFYKPVLPLKTRIELLFRGTPNRIEEESKLKLNMLDSKIQHRIAVTHSFVTMCKVVPKMVANENGLKKLELLLDDFVKEHQKACTAKKTTMADIGNKDYEGISKVSLGRIIGYDIQTKVLTRITRLQVEEIIENALNDEMISQEEYARVMEEYKDFLIF